MLMLCSVLRLAAYIRGTGAKTRWAFVERLILCHQRSVAGFFLTLWLHDIMQKQWCFLEKSGQLLIWHAWRTSHAKKKRDLSRLAFEAFCKHGHMSTNTSSHTHNLLYIMFWPSWTVKTQSPVALNPFGTLYAEQSIFSKPQTVFSTIGYLKFLHIRNKILVLCAKYKIRRKVWLCLVKYHLPCDEKHVTLNTVIMVSLLISHRLRECSKINKCNSTRNSRRFVCVSN